MKELEEKILKDGKVFPGNVLKVDSFLNHQVDVGLLNEIGKEFYSLFKDCGVNKIFTIEASGIGIACITAQYFNVPVVFAKKSLGKNIAADVYSTQVKSYTHGRTYDVIVSQEFLNKEDKILIIDDFLAQGCALNGLISLIRAAGAEIVGAGIVIEKAFQQGGDLIRGEGIRVESLARVKSMSDDGVITFCD
jgi:xanthine phosphoribosyltransferase